jgi:thioredoxin-like negative regulator of GroEL
MHHRRVAAPVVLHFVASWAAAPCVPHRAEVVQAADTLGLTVTEYDVDEHQDVARMHEVLAVPSVALSEGADISAISGALSADELVARLRARLSDER